LSLFEISIKFGGFTSTRWIWFKLCCRQAHQNIGRNSYIDRYSKGENYFLLPVA